MPHKASTVLPRWSVAAPVVATIILTVAWGRTPALWLVLVVAVALILAVLAAVHHAEVVAHRIGEPFGSLVLAVAVTIIEVALVVSVMLGAADKAELAR